MRTGGVYTGEICHTAWPRLTYVDVLYMPTTANQVEQCVQVAYILVKYAILLDHVWLTWMYCICLPLLIKWGNTHMWCQYRMKGRSTIPNVPSLSAFVCACSNLFANHIFPRGHLSHFLHFNLLRCLYLLWLMRGIPSFKIMYVHTVCVTVYIIMILKLLYIIVALEYSFTLNTYKPRQWDVRYSTCCTHTYPH